MFRDELGNLFPRDAQAQRLRAQSFTLAEFLARYAPACGAKGVRIDDPRRCGAQLADALAADGPVIVECVVDQHEPPMPARVRKDQVSKLATALRDGTPNRRRIALDTVKDLLDEASFQASPARAIPDRAGKALSGLAGRLRDRADDKHAE